ncbi:protein turtle-like isoform X1 [Hylaeus anthracinus]|uniref:protein turtle-like isoform X1 n=1 Tax=Hylaeus volcanicus TaxID=313075 RepID=UPI0023B8217E|nr:protein turtle-like isoform X1 [Hylaeus volcanicus]XP_054010438.1 protein turtle-like isoform X1 [Hylaeus anthracinus]
MIYLRLHVGRSLRCNTNARHWNVFIVPLFPLWIIGAFCVKDIPISHIVALVGDPTYLPCDISTTHEGDSVHLVLWYREDLGTSVYSVDVRNRDFGIAARWSDDSVFSNRAYFMPDKQPAELGVDHIREEDAGIYRCRVDFQMGQTRNSKVNLTVIVPPHKIVIVDDSEIARNSMVGPYMEGDTLRLYCDVYGGKPTPTVSWHCNDKLVSNKTVSVRSGVTRSELVMKNLGRDDVRSTLTCNATNNNRSIPLSSSVYVDMNFSPLDVKIIGANQPLSAGKSYELMCTTSGSRPAATVTWWRNGQRLEESKKTTSSDGNTTTSILSFMATKADAGRHLSCRAENPIMGTKPIEDGWMLEIQYTPETTIQLGTSLNPNAIREGTDVYFDCLIHAKPSVYKVEWRHLGKTLHHNITQGIIISNQSLVLQGVDRKSAGNYTCVGYNTEGDGESSPFYLNVMFAPTCKPEQTKVYGVAKQEKANISCQVDANPSEVQFRWTFNNSAESIDVAGKLIAQAGTSSIVSYIPMTELDYGTLLCWATNPIGHQQVPCVYHIIPAGRPDMVHNCTTSNTSTNSFSVRCAEGFNGGLPQSFLLEVRESNSQELRANITSPVPRFSVAHLEAGALYQACIYAYNDKGRSEAMVVQAGTLRLPEKQLTSESERPRPNIRLMPMLSVMIGVVSALIIVAVIVMVVLRIQHSQVDEQSKSQIEDHGKQTKPVPIQRELRFREGSSLLSDEKHPASPFRKLESTGDISENDEKNPDIIPQQITAGDEPSEYLRKRRLVSTIETSPSRSLLEHSTVTSVSGHGSYVGYCTIRNGMPLHEFSNLTTKHKSFQPIVGDVYETGVCTLPRQHWPSQSMQSMSMTMSPPMLYGGLGVVGRACPSGNLLAKDVEARIPGQCCIQSQKDGKMTTPIVMAKRESSV